MSDIEFKNEFLGLQNDIAHIDLRLDKINANIILLQTNIDRITTLILNSVSNQNQDRGKLYSIQADILRTLALYNDNYQRLLDLKFKYRAEHDDFKIKTSKFTEIELKRNIQEADISYNNVILALNKLSENIGSNSNELPKFQMEFDKDEEL